MSTSQKNNEEEIELGSLFVIIGKGFSNLYSFIGKIFKSIFHFLITILLFIKGNIVKLFIAAILGGIIGSFLEFKKEIRYGADLTVQPNFESTRQLYNNVSFYNDLVKQKDTLLLAKTFNITKSEAASLKKFEVIPIKTENDILTSYDDLISSVDTLTVKSYSFDKFKNAFTQFDYKTHKISVQSTKNTIFSKLDAIIISSITQNSYFNKMKELTNENLNRTDLLFRKNLVQIDTLINAYKNVMLKEAEKQSNGTNIDLGGTQKKAKELEIFETTRRINKDLKKISEDKAEKSEVVNVISNFQSVGYEIKGIEKNYIFLLAALFSLVMVLFLLLKQLNTYLENYKK